MKKKLIHKCIAYIVLIFFGYIMLFPLLWLFMGSFKTTHEILYDSNFFPHQWSLDGYISGWKNDWEYNFGVFLKNTFCLVIPTVTFSVVSCVLVAYGFARFDFRLKKLLFSIMISTLMLPNAVLVIPRYMLFNQFGWLNTYLPFWIPAIFATTPFHIFMVYQFIRGIPKDLDEAAQIDGCGPLRILAEILMPLLKPIIFSVAVFQVLWNWNDFFNVYIYISDVGKYTISLGLRMLMDVEATSDWNQIMAMCIVSIAPCTLFYFAMQKYFVEGVTSAAIKG